MRRKKTVTPGYHTWCAMKQRCYYTKNKYYDNYGGRGIKVCNEWKDDFWKFIEDMGERPSDEHSIERIDGNGNYEPSNCVWATRKEQANNRNTNVSLTFNGRTLNIVQWSKFLNIPAQTIYSRLRRDYPIDKVLSTKPDLSNSEEMIAVRLADKLVTIHQSIRAMCKELKFNEGMVHGRLREDKLRPYKGYVFTNYTYEGRARLEKII